MNTLNDLRQEFDEVDEALFILLERRLKLSQKMGALKEDQALGIYDPKREAQIFSRLQKTLEDPSLFPFIKEIYFCIFEASKRIQRQKDVSTHSENP